MIEEQAGRATGPPHPVPEREPFKVRLPGFVAETDVGLGDALKRFTSRVGLRHCGRCEQRAAALNRLIMFTGQRPR